MKRLKKRKKEKKIFLIFSTIKCLAINNEEETYRCTKYWCNLWICTTLEHILTRLDKATSALVPANSWNMWTFGTYIMYDNDNNSNDDKSYNDYDSNNKSNNVNIKKC